MTPKNNGDRAHAERTRLSRFLIAVAIAVAALAMAVVARADYIAYGQYFSGYVAPTQGGHTGYGDGCSGPWWEGNQAVWPGADPARVTYIDTSGGWHYTKKSGSSPLTQTITVVQSQDLGRTKERCENASDTVVYHLDCYYTAYVFSPNPCV